MVPRAYTRAHAQSHGTHVACVSAKRPSRLPPMACPSSVRHGQPEWLPLGARLGSEGTRTPSETSALRGAHGGRLSPGRTFTLGPYPPEMLPPLPWPHLEAQVSGFLRGHPFCLCLHICWGSGGSQPPPRLLAARGAGVVGAAHGSQGADLTCGFLGRQCQGLRPCDST